MNTDKYARCPTCGNQAYIRQNGALGAHYVRQGKARKPCPTGQLNAQPGRPGRRVRTTITSVIPAGWSDTEYRAKVRALLHEHAFEAFLVSIDVREDEDR